MNRLLSLVLLLGLAAPAAAQDAPEGPDRAECDGPRHHGRHGPGHRGPRMMRRIFSQLDLSDEQRRQLRQIHQEAREQGRALHESGDREALHRHRRQVHERVEAVLTDEQRAQARELRRQAMDRFLDRRLERMSRHLSLTEQQQQQVRGIMRGAAQQRRALMEQARLDEEDPHEAMRALHERTQAQIRAVLDSEQRARFDEHVQRRRRRHHRRGR